MLTLVEEIGKVYLAEAIKLEPGDAPQYRHPWDLVASAVYAFRRDAAYFQVPCTHVEGYNKGSTFYLECWK